MVQVEGLGVAREPAELRRSKGDSNEPISARQTHSSIFSTLNMPFGPQVRICGPASAAAGLALRTARLRWARSCQGTRLEWCSITLSTISSPSPMYCPPQLLATRLMASVAPRVNTTSRSDRAWMNCTSESRIRKIMI